MPLRTKVWSYGKLLFIAGALVGTFLLFAGISMRVATRVRQVTVPDLVGKPIAEATLLAGGLDLPLRIEEKRPPAASAASACGSARGRTLPWRPCSWARARGRPRLPWPRKASPLRAWPRF